MRQAKKKCLSMLKEYSAFNIEKGGEYYLEQTHLTLERAQTRI